MSDGLPSSKFINHRKYLLMKKSIIAISLAVLLFSNLSAQVTMNGATLPAKLTQLKPDLQLNGAGVRTKFFMKVYVSGLYLLEKNKDPKVIINADQPMAVRMHIISSILTSANMTTAIKEGFDRSTGYNTKPIQAKIDILLKVFNKETIKIGDIFDIYYVPKEGIKIYKNGVLQGPAVPGMDIKRAIFGIWLCPDPVEQSLKLKMLGL